MLLVIIVLKCLCHVSTTSEEDNTEGSTANEGAVFKGTYFECKCTTRKHKHNSLLDHNHYLVTAEKLFCDICLLRRFVRFGETYKRVLFK